MTPNMNYLPNFNLASCCPISLTQPSLPGTTTVNPTSQPVSSIHHSNLQLTQKRKPELHELIQSRVKELDIIALIYDYYTMANNQSGCLISTIPFLRYSCV